jgi:hypothetical protein
MKCSRCGLDAERTYQCEHTYSKDMCKECYQEIHWLLVTANTNNGPKHAY